LSRLSKAQAGESATILLPLETLLIMSKPNRPDKAHMRQPLPNLSERDVPEFGTVRMFPLSLPHDARLYACQRLNQLIADTMFLHALYRKHHGQVTGATFYQLHLLFDKLANEQMTLIDEMAERVPTLGGVASADPRHASEITRVPRPPNGCEVATALLSRLLGAHETIVGDAHDAAARVGRVGDHGSSDVIVSGVIRTGERQSWFGIERLAQFHGAAGPHTSSAGAVQGKPNADKVAAFTAANPETARQAAYVAARPLPGSYAGMVYWGVHTFSATNAGGKTQSFKFKIVPEAGEITLSDEDAKSRAADFLNTDLVERLARRPIKFGIAALLKQPNDPDGNLTERWPDEDKRTGITLGTISLIAIENNEACDAAIFDPANLADGISAPTDELFRARQEAYAISIGHRRK
jgi:starvation-inducible DNA-binding protein